MSCTSSDLDKNTCKVLKRTGQNCSLSLRSQGFVKDGQTDCQADGQTDASGKQLLSSIFIEKHSAKIPIKIF